MEALVPDALRTHVPRLPLLSVLVEPRVDVVISHEAGRPRAVLAARACSLNGSDLVRRLQLEELFALEFVQLAWAPDEEGSGAAALAAGPGGAASSSSLLRGALQIGVAAEVVPPFSLLPRPELEAACNRVLRASIAALLPRFLGRLGEDYERWGAIEAHRAWLAAAGQERGGAGGQYEVGVFCCVTGVRWFQRARGGAVRAPRRYRNETGLGAASAALGRAHRGGSAAAENVQRRQYIDWHSASLACQASALLAAAQAWAPAGAAPGAPKLSGDIKALDKKLSGDIEALDSTFDRIDAQFDRIDAQLNRSTPSWRGCSTAPGGGGAEGQLGTVEAKLDKLLNRSWWGSPAS